MPQKYKVFIEERPLLITVNVPSDKDSGDFSLVIRSVNKVDWEKIYEDLSNGSESGVWVVSDEPKESFSEFRKLFDLTEAAGGLVKDGRGKYLFILRNDRWDLPKGKLESGEGREEGAVREVEEECGLQRLNILESLHTTWHTYERKGRNHLKPTYWYLMEIPDEQSGKGQLEEGIEEVRWFEEGELQEVLSQTYPNIRELVSSYLNRPRP